jgi:hypothetical protein
MADANRKPASKKPAKRGPTKAAALKALGLTQEDLDYIKERHEPVNAEPQVHEASAVMPVQAPALVGRTHRRLSKIARLRLRKPGTLPTLTLNPSGTFATSVAWKWASASPARTSRERSAPISSLAALAATL